MAGVSATSRLWQSGGACTLGVRGDAEVKGACLVSADNTVEGWAGVHNIGRELRILRIFPLTEFAIKRSRGGAPGPAAA